MSLLYPSSVVFSSTLVKVSSFLIIDELSESSSFWSLKASCTLDELKFAKFTFWDSIKPKGRRNFSQDLKKLPPQK